MGYAVRIFAELSEAKAADLVPTWPLEGLNQPEQPFLLATIHRAVNTDDPARLGAILTTLGQAHCPCCCPSIRVPGLALLSSLDHLLGPLTFVD